MLSGVRAAFGALVLNLIMAGAASAAGCSAADIVGDVAFFRDRMTIASRGAATIVYVHKDDQRISASFQTAPVSAPDSDVSRYAFAAAQQDSLYQSQISARARGATVATSVIPDDPVQWRIFYSNDSSYGQDRLVGQYGIYVSATCLLTATISAPEGDRSVGDAFKRRWNDLVAAMDEVRASAGRVGEPIRFAQEDLSPKGSKAYVTGLGVPALAATTLFLLLNFFVTIGRPSMIARAMLGLAALSTGAALIGNSGGWLPGQVPSELVVLLSACTCICLIGSALPARYPALLATCIAGGTGCGLIGYAVFGWTPNPDVTSAVGAMLLLCMTVSALSWGSARRFVDAI